MIYGWAIVIGAGLIKHVAAEKLHVTHSGILMFYVDDKVVAAFRDWVSVERLPSE